MSGDGAGYAQPTPRRLYVHDDLTGEVDAGSPAATLARDLLALLARDATRVRILTLGEQVERVVAQGPHAPFALALGIGAAGQRVAEALHALLTWEQQRRLDELAPTHLVVPSGSRIPIEYLADAAPSLSVRLQEVFGLADTPRIAGGRVPVMMKLLSPAQRPVQVTQDLRSFWEKGYHDVKKELKGRYPKHYWPDDPWQAQPTRRVKPR